MIRMVLFAIAFVAITVALVLFQPGARNTADVPVAADVPITRAEPALTVTAPAPTRPAPALPTPPAPRVPQDSAGVDDRELRRMTWETLSSLNRTTGKESAPGQPGSLLHTIVRRSLDDQAAPPRLPNPAMIGTLSPSDSYVVQPGDSLVSIAEKIYGDVNMTGPLFAANTSQLTRPDDLRPGQVLVLPSR